MQGLYLACALPVYLLVCIVPQRPEQWVFGALRGNAYDGNAKYLFEYVNKQTDIKAAWITRKSALVKQMRAKGYRCFSFYSLRGLWFAMNSKVAVVTHMGNNWRGDLPFFALNRKSRLVQLWHGIPLKKIGFDDSIYSQKKPDAVTRLLSLPTLKVFPFSQRIKYPDIVIALSEETRRLFSSAFRVDSKLVKITGYPRNDVLFTPMRDCRMDVVKAIFMPTFRGEEGAAPDLLAQTNFDIDAIDKFCIDRQIEIDIKLHPFNFPTSEMLHEIAKSEFVRFINVDDVYPQLSNYDVLITDYSSVYFDFLLLDRPMIFFPFNHDDFVKRDRELYFDYDEVTPGPKANSWAEVLSFLADLEKLESDYRLVRQQIKQTFHEFQDAGSCQRVCSAIKDCVNG